MDRLRSLLDRAEAWFAELFPSWFPPDLPGWGPGIAFAWGLALVLGIGLGPQMHISRWRLSVWLGSLLMVAAATWTIPTSAERLPGTLRWCTQGDLPRPSMLINGFSQEIVSNVLMLIPAGAAAVLWPLGVRRLAALCVALATPPLIEFVQLIPALHRGCQVADVVNNSVGVILGFFIAAGIETFVLSLRATRGVGPPVATAGEGLRKGG